MHVDLRPPPLSRLSPKENNYFRFRMGPTLGISIGARVKKPGAEVGSMATELVVVRESAHGEAEAYERLLTDAMRGDQTLFVRADCIEVAWQIFDDILEDGGPVYPYNPGTWGPAEADRLVAPLEGWKNPLP